MHKYRAYTYTHTTHTSHTYIPERERERERERGRERERDPLALGGNRRERYISGATRDTVLEEAERKNRTRQEKCRCEAKRKNM